MRRIDRNQWIKHSLRTQGRLITLTLIKIGVKLNNINIFIITSLIIYICIVVILKLDSQPYSIESQTEVKSQMALSYQVPHYVNFDRDGR